MSVFDIKGNNSNYWNYSDSSKDNYSEMLEGTVVEIIYTQKYNTFTKQLDFWPQGDPKMQYHIVFAVGDDEWTWTIDAIKKSAAVQACCKALDPNGDKDRVSLEELLGKHVRVQTQAGQYGVGRPRPWWVTIIGEGAVNLVRGLTDKSPGKQPQQAPAPAPMPAPAPAPAPAATPLQVAQQAAAQAVAAQNFQPQVGGPAPQVAAGQYAPASVYDQDIPF